MKNFRFFLVGMVLVLGEFKGYSQVETENWDWKYRVPDQTLTKSGLTIDCMVIDDYGNAYVCGNFIDTVSLTCKGKTRTFTTNGGFNSFLAKYNIQGELIWISALDGPEDCDEPASDKICLDKKGHIYFSGEFTTDQGITNMEIGGFKLQGNNLDFNRLNIFVACYDTSGKVKWATSTEGSEVYDINFDNNGRCIITANNYWSNLLRNHVLDSTGKVILTDSFYTQGKFNNAIISNDIANNSYISGSFSENINIGGKTFHFNNDTFQFASFLVKYDPAYKVKWAKLFENQKGDVTIEKLITDKYGNTFITGGFTSNYKIDNYGETVFSHSSYMMVDSIKLPILDSFYSNIFFASFDSNGKVRWAHTLGGGSNLSYAGIDKYGNYYLIGNIYDTIKFGNELFKYSFRNNGFIAKYDNNGVFLWAENLPATSSATIDENGNIYVIGLCDTTINLGKVTLNLNTSNNIFIAKYKNDGKIVWAKDSCILGDLSVNSSSDVAISETSWEVINWYQYDGYIGELSPCIRPVTLGVNGNTAYCIGDTVKTVLTSSQKGYSYQWYKDTIILKNDTGQNYMATAAGTYKVLVTNSAGCQAFSDEVEVVVYPMPGTPTITKIGDTLVSSSQTNNQWYRNDTLVPGATNQKYIPTTNAKYSVQVVYTKKCEATSNEFSFTGIDKEKSNIRLSIYPNPFTSQTIIECTSNEKGMAGVSVYDMTGRVIVKEEHINCISGQFSYTFDASKYGNAGGIFIVKINIGNLIVTKEIVKINP